MQKIKYELLRIYRDPREIHRVCGAILMAAITSQLVFLWSANPKGVPVTYEQWISIALMGTLYIGGILWVLLSNPLNFDLSIRFFWGAALSVLGHRVIIGAEQLGSWYFTLVALLSIAMLMVFVITGKTKNELKVWFSINQTENKNAQTNYPVIGNSTDSNQHNVGGSNIN